MNKCVLCFIFDKSMNNVLLLERKYEPYKGKLNGLGGKMEEGEDPFTACQREVLEESGIDLYVETTTKLLASLSYPSGLELHVFYATLRYDFYDFNSHEDIGITEEGYVGWYKADLFTTVNDKIFAGEGNISYFIQAARIMEGKV